MHFVAFPLLLTIGLLCVNAWELNSNAVDQVGYALPLEPQLYWRIFHDYQIPPQASQPPNGTPNGTPTGDPLSVYVDFHGHWDDGGGGTTTPPPAFVDLAISAWAIDPISRNLEIQSYSLDDNRCQTTFKSAVVSNDTLYHCEIGSLLPYLLPPPSPSSASNDTTEQQPEYVVGIQLVSPTNRAFVLNVETLVTNTTSSNNFTYTFWELNTTRYAYRTAHYQEIEACSNESECAQTTYPDLRLVLAAIVPQAAPITTTNPAPTLFVPSRVPFIIAPPFGILDLLKSAPGLFIVLSLVILLLLVILVAMGIQRIIKSRNREARTIEMVRMAQYENGNSAMDGTSEVDLNDKLDDIKPPLCTRIRLGCSKSCCCYGKQRPIIYADGGYLTT